MVPTANVLKRGLPLCLSETVSVAGPIPGLCFKHAPVDCNFTFGQFLISSLNAVTSSLAVYLQASSPVHPYSS